MNVVPISMEPRRATRFEVRGVGTSRLLAGVAVVLEAEHWPVGMVSTEWSNEGFIGQWAWKGIIVWDLG